MLHQHCLCARDFRPAERVLQRHWGSQDQLSSWLCKAGQSFGLCGRSLCYRCSGRNKACSSVVPIQKRPLPQVDTHVHHSACMHQKHLLRFIKSKLKKEPDEVVIFRDGKWLTLREVFESLTLTGCASSRENISRPEELVRLPDGLVIFRVWYLEWITRVPLVAEMT